MKFEVKSEVEMKELGRRIGALLEGGEVIELIGDVGAGKTTFVKGIAVGLDVTDNVQSPSFTISRLYNGRSGLVLAHYDFYRLQDAGIMSSELLESFGDGSTITVIEWGEIVKDILPNDKMTIRIEAVSETSRKINISLNGNIDKRLAEIL